LRLQTSISDENEARPSDGGILVNAAGVVVRSAHRSGLARTLALCLVLLGVSPVTAPFTTCELADFTQSQPTDTSHHPGRQLAEAHPKIAPHVITIACELAPGLLLVTDDGAQAMVNRDGARHTRQDLHTVLRL